MRTWFAVENSLVDRNDLTAYEKLCGMVLARYAGREEFDHLLTTDIIAVKMGVASQVALEALRGLVRKGLIDVDSTSDLFAEGSENHIKEIELEEFRDEKDTGILKSNNSSVEPELLQLESLDEVQEVESEGQYFDPLNENEFDNFDKMLQSSKENTIQNEQTATNAETEQHVSNANNTAVKGYQTYGNLKETEQSGVTVESTDDAMVSDIPDPEMLKKSIHEQSDSVRAWIEDSEPAISIEPVVKSTPTVDREMLVTQVMNMIEEPINDRQARIILGLAEYDLERVSKCYLAAQSTQVTDKIDMLIHELQKKDEPKPVTRVPKSSQVDFAKLNQMKKYQEMNKKK